MTSALLLWHFNIIISTHTLTWSVTIGVNANYNMKRISTHTLTWSVTGSGTADNVAFAISTHTLTWSVTVYFIALAL